VKELTRFEDEYEQLRVPVVSMTGNRYDDPRVENRIQRHFEAIARSLGLNYLMASEYLSVETDAEVSQKPSSQFTLYEHLKFQEIQVLATATRKIGSGVLRQVQLTKEPLEPETITALKELHHADTVLTALIFNP
jgi:hypothetical protein